MADSVGGGVAEMAFVYPLAIDLDVRLIEDSHAVRGTALEHPCRRPHEPLLPRHQGESRKLGDVRK
jgi:hypothetical protein